jgi:uncharacterized protein (TIGR00255 family)
MNSMTGYGRGAVERDGRQLTLEIRSVNHRFLDLSLRLPRSLGFCEQAIRERVGKRLSRGHADVFATYRNLRDDSRTAVVDPALLTAYLAALDGIARAAGLPDDRSVMRVAAMRDGIVVTEAEEDPEALMALTMDALDLALDDLAAMRAKEGAAMARDMAGRIDALEAVTEKIEARYPQALEEYAARLRARIEELVASCDEQRLLQEVAIMADRSAIAEETVRLRSHFSQIRGMLAASEPTGRKLDFIVQELNREVNTISSKSQDIPITQLVVLAKSEIEKLREQVQNVE